MPLANLPDPDAILGDMIDTEIVEFERHPVIIEKPISSEERQRQQSELAAHINERKAMAAQFYQVTPEQIIGATAMRAFGSIDGAFDKRGNFDIQKARRTGAIHLIKKLEKTQHGFRVEFYSNESAQARLGNYLGLDKAPESSEDITSLKLAVDEVALYLANGEPVTNEIRREAWKQVQEWAQEKRAKYSPKALQAMAQEYKD